jgi:hypothetical protein
MGIPSTGRFICLMNGGVGFPRREIELFVDENFQPEYPLPSCRLNCFGNGIRP